MKTDLLASRHIGINEQDTAIMLRKIGVNSLDELINQTIPANFAEHYGCILFIDADVTAS